MARSAILELELPLAPSITLTAVLAGKPLACTCTLVPGPPFVGVSLTVGDDLPVDGIVAEPLDELCELELA